MGCWPAHQQTRTPGLGAGSRAPAHGHQGPVPAHLKGHKSWQFLVLDGEPCTKHLPGPGAHQLQPTTLAGADWQKSPPPHLPMAMYSCRIWPKGRRRLNWSCPSKERESYRGSGAKEARAGEEKEMGRGMAGPALVPASGRRGGGHRQVSAASSSPAPHTLPCLAHSPW